MNKVVKIISAPFRYICYGMIYAYKYTISKILPDCCLYEPTCSTYTLIAIKRFGIFRGILMGMKRIYRCRPKYKGGLDPVPDNIKSDIKYVI